MGVTLFVKCRGMSVSYNAMNASNKAAILRIDARKAETRSKVSSPKLGIQ